MALRRWELLHTPVKEDKNRWQLKLTIDEDSLVSCVDAVPGKRGRPFSLKEKGFDFAVYLDEVSPDNLFEISKALNKQCAHGQLAGPGQDAVILPVMERIAKELDVVVFNADSAQQSAPAAVPAGAGQSSRSGASVQTQTDRQEEDSNDGDDSLTDMELNKNYVFEEFVIGPNNRFTAAAAQAVADNPAKIYNPFFIYGGVGLGKTHLMHAVGNYVRKKNLNAKILYVSTEKFMSDVIDSIRHGTLKKMRDHYRKADLLLIDDIQFLEESESTQEEFFHTFNTLHQNAKQIIITSDKPPKRLTTLEDRLRSRFEWGLIADIKSPNLETRVAILKRKEKGENLNLDDNILLYIASKLKSNIRELEGFLKRINAYAALTKQEVNMDLVKSLMADLLPADEQDEAVQQAPKKEGANEYVIKTAHEPAQPKNPAQDTSVHFQQNLQPQPPQEPAAAMSQPAPEYEQPVVKAGDQAAVPAEEEVLVVKQCPPPPQAAFQYADPAEQGLKVVEVGFFYPEKKTEEFTKVKERFKEVIRKHKLKFKLESIFEKEYAYVEKIDYSLFFQLCREKDALIAIVLGPPMGTPESAEEFSNMLSSVMDEQKISLQLVPWADLNKDYRYLNLSLDITLLKHRS